MPKIQLVTIVMVSAFFYLFDAPVSGFFAGLSAAYGGAISLANTGLINKHMDKQIKAPMASAQASVGAMFTSVIIRMAVVASLVLAGLALLDLNAGAMIAGLVLGLIGFLIDKVLQK